MNKYEISYEDFKKLSNKEKLNIMNHDVPKKEYLKLLNDYNELAQREVVLLQKIQKLESK